MEKSTELKSYLVRLLQLSALIILHNIDPFGLCGGLVFKDLSDLVDCQADHHKRNFSNRVNSSIDLARATPGLLSSL